jgi:hypothetical protein
VAWLAAGLVTGCSELPTTSPSLDPAFSQSVGWEADLAVAKAYLQSANERLAAQGAGFVVESAEWFSTPGVNPASSHIVFVFDHFLTTGSRWVPGDARRLANGNTITYSTFLPLAVAPGVGNVANAIDVALATWAGVDCFKPTIVERNLAANINPSALLGIGGFVNNPLAADVDNIGWIPGAFFDLLLGPGASAFILGVTISFAFANPDGSLSDVDNDGNADTAHKEIWYNNSLPWSANGVGGADVLSVVLHENGHGLELGHFGSIHATLSNLRLHASPRAVMNAIILGVLRQPLGTDVGALCQNFASWPD